MKLPFHAVVAGGDILFTARGANIHSFNLTNGTHISCSWRFPAAEGKDAAPRREDHLVINVSENSTPAMSQDEQGPPAKRLKLDNSEEANGEDTEMQTEEKPAATGTGQISNEEQTAILRGGGSGGKRKNKNKKQSQPGPLSAPTERAMIILMTATQDGHYLVAVTSDKSIWVLEHDGQGQLKQLSRRTMPKRPCSIFITPDNCDILSADKFGDVYSLPLIQSPDWKPKPLSDASAEAGSPAPSAHPPSATEQQAYKPQATELTVHTGRNRKALLDQQISRSNPKAQRGTPRRAEPEPFERYLLLGHVSLLTAVALGFDDQSRPYILTADRDEHIRVSRGTREQAHVIERFCLGHEDFVNRLCIPSGMGEILVSAGGDPEVFVWRWREGQLLGKTNLLDAVKGVVPEATKVAVTGLCQWPAANADNEETGTRMVVICERVPAVFLFILQKSGALIFSRTIQLAGNPLDITVTNSETLVVVVDTMLKEGDVNDVSTSIVKVERIGAEDYRASNGSFKVAPESTSLGDDDEVEASEAEVQKLLYSAETLRKMDSEEGEAD